MTSNRVSTGQCMCGQVTYTIAKGTEGFAVVCHCNRCKHQSGSAFGVTYGVPRTALTINGLYRTYATIGSSGIKSDQVFCPTCGSAIVGLPQEGHPRANTAFIKAGTLDEETRKASRFRLKVSGLKQNLTTLQSVKPAVELFTESKMPFVKEAFGKQFQTTPPAPA